MYYSSSPRARVKAWKNYKNIRTVLDTSNIYIYIKDGNSYIGKGRLRFTLIYIHWHFISLSFGYHAKSIFINVYHLIHYYISHSLKVYFLFFIKKNIFFNLYLLHWMPYILFVIPFYRSVNTLVKSILLLAI